MKKRTKYLLLGLGLVVLGGANLMAQSKLAPSANNPSIDGTIGEKEYSYVSSGKGITFALSLSADGKTLYAALSAPTAGWVAIGLGSPRMNKSFMVLGYDDGKSTVAEFYGTGHDIAPANQNLVQESMARKSGNLTTLEFKLPAATLVKGDKVDVILATSNKPNFRVGHNWKTAFSVAVGQ